MLALAVVASLCCWMILWWRLRWRRRRVLTVLTVEALVLLSTEALVLMVSTALVLFASLAVVFLFRIQEVVYSRWGPHAGATVAVLVHILALPHAGASGTAAPVSDTAAHFSDTVGCEPGSSVAVAVGCLRTTCRVLDPPYAPQSGTVSNSLSHCGMPHTATLLSDHHSTLL